MQRTLLTLALIATAGVSYAQTMSNEPRDAYGRPLVGRNDYVRQPGDQPGPGMATRSPTMGYSSDANVANAPRTFNPANPPQTYEKTTNNNKLERGHAVGQEPGPAPSGPRQTAFKDEYGFRYDSEGNRLDARGNIISPHTPQR